MGEVLADTHFHLHGEGTTYNAIQVRLHWGDESIDETLTMSSSAFASLCADHADDDETSFRSDFETWVNSNASAAAKAKKADFSAAAWAAFS